MPIDPSLQTPENYATPSQLAAMREYSKYLLENSNQPVRAPMQGMANVVRALIGGYESGQADSKEAKARQHAQALLQDKFEKGDLGGVIAAASDPYSNQESVKLAAGIMTPQRVPYGLGSVLVDRTGKVIPGSFISQSQIKDTEGAGAKGPVVLSGTDTGGVNYIQPGVSSGAPPPGRGAVTSAPLPPQQGGQVPPAVQGPRPGGPVPSSPTAWGDQEAENAGLYEPTKPKSVRDSIIAAKSATDAAPGAATSPPGVDPSGPKQTTRQSVEAAVRKINGDSATPAPFNERFDPLADIARKGIAISAEKKAADTMAEEGAKARMVPIAEAAKEAKTAPQMLNSLNIIEDIARTTPMTTGMLGEPMLKLRQTVNGIAGRDLMGDTSGPEAIKKMNAYLASEATQAMTARGTQFDFKVNMANQPGNLETSTKGTLYLTSIMKQIARQNLDLARLAGDPRNHADWPNVARQYYESHPVINPLTQTPMGVSKDTPQQMATTDKEGYTIVNGRRFYNKNGQWFEK